MTFFSATRDKRPSKLSRFVGLGFSRGAILTIKTVLGSAITTWSSLEINLAIICSSVASLKPLFARFIGLIPHSEAKSTDRNTRGYQPAKQHSDQSWVPLETFNERTQTTWHSIDDVEAATEGGKFWADQNRGAKTSIVAGTSNERG